MTWTDGIDEPEPHRPSFHTKPWDSRHDPGVLVRAVSATQAEENPLARPHYADSQILGLQHDPLSSLLASPGLRNSNPFRHWPRPRTHGKPYGFKLSKENMCCSWHALRA